MKVKVKENTNNPFWRNYAGTELTVGDPFESEVGTIYTVQTEGLLFTTIITPDCFDVIEEENHQEQPQKLTVMVNDNPATGFWKRHPGTILSIERNDKPSDSFVVTGPKEFKKYFIFDDDFTVIASPQPGKTSQQPVEENGIKTVKISLDTARKIYNNTSTPTELVDWLLENFTKEELEPKKGFTWEESFSGEGCFISPNSDIAKTKTDKKTHQFKNIFKTREQAESALAFAQLSHIVAKYNEGKTSEDLMYAVMPSKNGLRVEVMKKEQNQFMLDFCDVKDAETSAQANRELWEKYWLL